MHGEVLLLSFISMELTAHLQGVKKKRLRMIIPNAILALTGWAFVTSMESGRARKCACV